MILFPETKKRAIVPNGFQLRCRRVSAPVYLAVAETSGPEPETCYTSEEADYFRGLAEELGKAAKPTTEGD